MRYTVVSPFNYEGSFRNGSDFNLKTKRKNKFIRGAVYRLRQKICSDPNICSVVDKTYLCVGIVHQIGEVPFNGVIMKQLSGEHPKQIFTLSKDQCQILHIHYEKGLEVFADNTKFERLIEDFPNTDEYTAEDFSTYPHSPTDGTIRQILVRFDDLQWKDQKRNKIFNPQTKKYYKLVKENDKQNDIISIGGVIVKSLAYLKSKDYKGESKSLIVNHKPNEVLTYNLLTDLESEDIVVSIILTNVVMGGFTEDGYIGLDKNQFKGKKFEELFTIIDDKE